MRFNRMAHLDRVRLGAGGFSISPPTVHCCAVMVHSGGAVCPVRGTKPESHRAFDQLAEVFTKEPRCVRLSRRGQSLRAGWWRPPWR